MTDQELYEQEIQYYMNTGLCPKCCTKIELISMHERDSSWDAHRCLKCKWEISEIQLWNKKIETSEENEKCL